MAAHICKEKENHLPLWHIVKIIDSEEYWKRRRLKEAAHLLVYSRGQHSPSIEMNTIWEPIIKKAKLNFFKKKITLKKYQE